MTLFRVLNTMDIAAAREARQWVQLGTFVTVGADAALMLDMLWFADDFDSPGLRMHLMCRRYQRCTAAQIGDVLALPEVGLELVPRAMACLPSGRPDRFLVDFRRLSDRRVFVY